VAGLARSTSIRVDLAEEALRSCEGGRDDRNRENQVIRLHRELTTAFAKDWSGAPDW
jgi:hypothetical protein